MDGWPDSFYIMREDGIVNSRMCCNLTAVNSGHIMRVSCSFSGTVLHRDGKSVCCMQ
jgi:hypothetical protein